MCQSIGYEILSRFSSNKSKRKSPVKLFIIDFVQLTDLPDGIIIIILNKSDNVEVLYSLINVSTRLNQIVTKDMIMT